MMRGLAKPSDLTEVLDELGIERGQTFVIATVEALGDPEAATLGPFVRDSTTSRQAALDAYPRAGTQRRRVLDYVLASEGGATRDEIEQALGLLHQTGTARVWELVKGGWLVETLGTRKTVHGEPASVLVASDKARAERQLAA